MIKSRFARIAINSALAIYSIIVFWGLYIGSYYRQHLTDFKYNLYPFKTIFTYIIEFNSNDKAPFVINIIGNIVLFIPFGFLLPITFQKRLNRLDKLLFACVLGILSIEIVQLVLKIGVFDIDDVILNGTGVLLGFIILKKIEL